MDSIEQCGKILSIKELAPKAEEISRNLKEKYEYAADRLGAFAIAKNGIRCCCNRHLVYVTDLQFHPLLAYESSSFMTQCAISENAKYIVFQMARNPEDDADSGATILLDVKAKSIAARRRLETGFNTGKGIAIDERSNTVAVYMTAANGNAAVTYDFNLIPDKESLYNYYVNSLDCSPYVRNEAIEAALDEVSGGLSDWREAREKIYPLLEAQKVSLEMSHYQLALTYKRLGDLLAERGDAQEAALAYETGLVLNSKLSVKKALKKIYKDFPDMEKPTPRVYSVEREMAWAQEPYELPSTYTPKEGEAQAERASYLDTETYKNLTGSDKELADGMADFLHGLGQTFMDGLKTEAYRFAESIEGLEEMSDGEFSDLFNALCKRLEPPQRAEARRTAEIRISERQTEPALTVRQLIVMDVYNMVKSYTGESIEI